jgi:predicted transcriptional regulator
MADHPSIKPDARQLIESLPESATWDDLAYKVYVRQAIEIGLAEADAGQTVPHDEVIARVRNWIRHTS